MRFLSFATLVEFIAEHLLVLICCASLVLCVPRLKTTDLTPVQLADFKRNFLNMIGLRNRPPVRTKRSVLQVPDYLWDIYRQLGTGHLRDQNGRRMTAVRSSHGNGTCSLHNLTFLRNCTQSQSKDQGLCEVVFAKLSFFLPIRSRAIGYGPIIPHPLAIEQLLAKS